MKYNTKMDNLVLLIFILSIFILPAFILIVIHHVMLKYEITTKGIKVNGLIKNIDIKYDNIISFEPKKYNESIIMADSKSLLTALSSDGVIIKYMEEEKEQELFISPARKDSFVGLLTRYIHERDEARDKADVEPIVVDAEIIEQ